MNDTINQYANFISKQITQPEQSSQEIVKDTTVVDQSADTDSSSVASFANFISNQIAQQDKLK
jgi:hypothetical protein